jgi:voltage-gated potassium channel
MERLQAALWRVSRFLAGPDTYTLLAFSLVILLVGGAVVILLLESANGGQPALRDWNNALTFMLQNVSGVGLGAQVPLTFVGRLAGILFVLLGAALRAVLLAAIVSGFVNRLLARSKGVRRVGLEKHIIICGWNSRLAQVVEVLQREAFGAGVPIVLLAQLPENPLPNEALHFISGNPSHAEDLERAGIQRARAAIAVTDESDKDPHMDSTYDARAVLTVLALKAANPQLHVVAQMRDPRNRDHFERARANEIIASAEMSEGLLARSALNIGIAKAFSQLLRLDTPQEVYIIDAPPRLEGKTFQAALVHEQIRSGNILLGVMESGKTLLCPPSEYRIHGDSRLVVLGNVRPKLDH